MPKAIVSLAEGPSLRGLGRRCEFTCGLEQRGDSHQKSVKGHRLASFPPSPSPLVSSVACVGNRQGLGKYTTDVAEIYLKCYRGDGGTYYILF